MIDLIEDDFDLEVTEFDMGVYLHTGMEQPQAHELAKQIFENKKKDERLQKYVEYLYQLSIKGKLDTQAITILIQLGNWVKNGDIGLAPDEFRKKK